MLMRHRDNGRITREALHELSDRLRHRGREEDRLPIFRHLRKRGLNILTESHVQHFVRFIEDDGLGLVKLQRASTQVIQHTPRGTNDDLSTALYTLDLTIKRRPTEDGKYVQLRHEARQLVEFARDLHGQFSRRAENHRLDSTELWIQTLDQRNAESGRLARTGRRLANKIPPLQKGWQRSRLDRCSQFVAQRINRLLHLVTQVEVSERTFFHGLNTVYSQHEPSSEIRVGT